MNKAYLFLIALFFGTGLGFLLAASTGAELEGHDHADPAVHGPGTGHLPHDGEAGHAHATLDITQDPAPKPGLSLTLHHDGDHSYNLQVDLVNFTLTPAAVNGPHVPGTGHAHIFVDGVKLTRLYGDWFLLSNLTPGSEVTVTLNANSHEALVHGGEKLEASITVPDPG